MGFPPPVNHIMFIHLRTSLHLSVYQHLWGNYCPFFRHKSVTSFPFSWLLHVCIYPSNPLSICPVTAQTGSPETRVTRCGREWEEGEVVLQDVTFNHFHNNVLRVSQHSRTKSPQGGRTEWEEERKQGRGWKHCKSLVRERLRKEGKESADGEVRKMIIDQL